MAQENLTEILDVVKNLKGHELEARPLESISVDLYLTNVNSNEVYCGSDCSLPPNDCVAYCRDCSPPPRDCGYCGV
ncbi:MAG: hypothetical protein ISS82_05585 [Nanoarchaeota archaeon]|nr:hypothetical protein [Nanoarchaeota archaeon]